LSLFGAPWEQLLPHEQASCFLTYLLMTFAIGWWSLYVGIIFHDKLLSYDLYLQQMCIANLLFAFLWFRFSDLVVIAVMVTLKIFM
jgi:hypothetical protein